ncbi:MAG: S9 family peptidase [Pseudomonadota bacterium]
MRKKSIALLSAFAIFGLQAEARDLELADWLNWERASNPQISPDGSEILYTRQRVDSTNDRWASEVWIMNADGGRHRYLADGGGVEWSPNGDRIAYMKNDPDGGENAKTQLFVRWMDAEGAVSQITHGDHQPNHIEWSPNGDWIAFRAQTPLEPDFQISLPKRPKDAKWTEDALVVERLHYRIDRVGNKEGFDHLFIAPADGGTPRQITSGKWDVGAKFSGIDATGGIRWTPDGGTILFDGVTDPHRELDGMSSDINAIDIATGEIRKLQPEDGFWSQPRISPNGRLIAYTGNRAIAENYPPQELRVMNADGSGDRVLIPDLPDGIGQLEWASNGRSLYYSMNVSGSTNIYNVDMSGRVRTVTRGEHRLFLSSIKGNNAAAVISSPKVTSNVARVSLGNGSVRQLTDLNSDILYDVELGDVEEINYKSADGTDVQGWLVKPADYDASKKYPLVLSIHGGPHAMYGVNFQFRFHEFASNGYLVLYTNPRGSTGYGAEFANAIDNAYPGRADYEDLMGGVDALLERGIVDEERMYATGCSGGGVLTSWIVTQTNRFAAAAALCPVINWISFAGQADIGRWSFARFRPFYWEDPTNWLEHSPIMHVQNVETPTLLMTGDKDLRTPIAQAEEFYAALKMRGVPTKLIAMKNEYHGTTSIPSNMLRTQLYLRKWFAEYGGVPLEEESE